MADLHSSAVVKTGQVVILASSSGSAKTTTTGTVVDITLQPNTIATIFGAIQDVAVNEQIVLAQLFGKGITVEKTATLDGPKDSPYHVVDDDKNYAVVWGPFMEKKKIQVALYWINSSGNGLQPIDTDEIKEFSDDKLRTKVTLIPVFRKNKDDKVTLRTVVNVTRMKVKE